MGKIKKGLFVIIATILLDMIIIHLGIYEKLPFHIGWSVGCVGIINFFSVLLLAGVLDSGNVLELKKEYMRHAIAATFITMYILFLALLSFEESQLGHITNTSAEYNILNPMMSNFSTLVALVVGFYFASSSVSEYLKFKSNDNKNDSNKDELSQEKAV